ncbi:hypothetical protein K488DRAFT_34225, partial [Vararia minispora EC-137]
IDQYMYRTGTTGGGAPSREDIARTMFSLSSNERHWKSLTSEKKRLVRIRQGELHTWFIRREVGAIFSASCRHEARCSADGSHRECEECEALRRHPRFRAAINKPIPAEKNARYTPIEHRQVELGKLYMRYNGLKSLVELDDGQSPFLRFAKAAAEGSYRDCEVLVGLIEALTIKSERELKGRSMKNMKYSPALDGFFQVLHSLSPAAYKTFRRHLVGRHPRSLRYV